MIKSKKQSLIVIGVFTLVLALVTTTYAFFNYTRTGSSNTIRVGRISFVSKNEETITLNNLFPIDPSNTSDLNDNTKVGTYSIDVKGDTDYVDGIEYLVSAVDANIYTSEGQIVPITLDFTVTDLGDPSTNYFTVRENTNVSIYKKLVGDTLVGDQMLLVGFIKPNNPTGTVEGIDGSITIKAYLDKNKIGISDTYDGTESDNDGTTNTWANERTIITTSEWNAIQSAGVSFKVKVEANEGIWVEGPLNAYTQLAKNADITKQINFAEKSSDTNGKGLYRLFGTENDTYPIYYYRGDIDNNNVVFGDYCWQIVRTTDTGGIKMIYNGEAKDLINYDSSIIMNDTDITYKNDSTYPYTYDSQTKKWTSTNHTNNKDATFKFYPKSRADYVINYTISSELQYDNVSFYKNGDLIKNDSGENNGSITLRDLKTTDAITINYYKNYSISSGNDNVIFEIVKNSGTEEIGKVCDNLVHSDRIIPEKVSYNVDRNSVSDVGYMYNKVYSYKTINSASGSIYGKDVEWDGTNYLLIEDVPNVPSTNTTIDNYHHYTCGVNGVSSCSVVRYYYQGYNIYIELSDGEKVEDALYKMTGNGTLETKSRPINQNYILNTTDSYEKTAIENWFRSNLTNEVDATQNNLQVYIEDTVYCNDRSFKTREGNTSYQIVENNGWNPNGGNINSSYSINFGAKDRVWNNWYSTTNVPSFECPNETDSFSVSNLKAPLNYPIGLLIADEVVLAGAAGNGTPGNKEYYLYTGNNYNTMSPAYCDSTRTGIFIVDDYGRLNEDNLSYVLGIRPVISLKPGIEFETGGDGTPTNPYVVKYN